MKNNGKKLERIVKLIQETFKDSSNTIIKSNFKIKNISGRKREIDVYIESKISEFVIKIAIECKEYNSPVSVEKTEAFNSKCLRIPSINKKIFVSQSGYQSDAINAAKDFEIEIYDVRSIDTETVLSWLPVKQLGLRFEILNYTLNVESLDFVGAGYVSENRIYFSESDFKNIDDFVKSVIIEDRNELWEINILNFMRKSREEVNSKIKSNFRIDLVNAYIINEKNQKIVIKQIEGNIESWLVKKSPKLIESHSYGLSTKNSIANHITIDISPELKSEIVFTKDNFKMFTTNEKGESKEMVKLGTYDPKTDTYSINKN